MRNTLPPARVLAVAFLAGLFHIMPFVRAEMVAAPGWSFAENVTISPDYMQYRVWARQAAESGPLVENRFTTEPNRPHLFVAFYWVIGKTSNIFGTSPERVYAYIGIPLAIVLVLLLYATVRHFLPDQHAAWWTFLAIVLGGGLGAHLKLANEFAFLRESGLFNRLVTQSLDATVVFEEYRSHYVVKTLLDSHFLVIWIASMAAVLAFYWAIRRATTAWYAGAALLFACANFLHLYEGVTLIAIALGIVVCCWPLHEQRPALVRALAWCIAATVLSYALLLWWLASAGIPVPSWRAVNVLASVLLIAYPAAFGLIAWGFRDYWRSAGLQERVLVGWALGCTVVTLSGPFYPYPDRGTMTMQVPLTVIAGAIYFARWPRLTWKALVVGIALMGATPAWLMARTWKFSGFREDAPWMFLNASHRDVLAALGQQARPDDVMVADDADVLWLAPQFPGRHYVGHFFLTVDYERKLGELQRLLASASAADVSFLADAGVRWVFVNSSREPERFASIPGFVPVVRTTAGWLFEYRPSRTQ
jgi:hypothetical protein